MTKIKFVVTAKRESECRNVSKLKGRFRIFRTTKIPMEGSLENEFSIAHSAKKAEFWNDIFTDQNKPVATSKARFMKLRKLFGILWNIKFLTQLKESTIFEGNDLIRGEHYQLKTRKIEPTKF